jgi:hypothetical protein
MPGPRRGGGVGQARRLRSGARSAAGFIGPPWKVVRKLFINKDNNVMERLNRSEVYADYRPSILELATLSNDEDGTCRVLEDLFSIASEQQVFPAGIAMRR